MELDFDKEINALLRQTAKQDLLSAENHLQIAHLDADEISAFAENALPEKAKAKYTEHFADCGSCRKSLAELIQLNSETEIEVVTSTVAAVIPFEIPWYRKLFIFPGLAYTMGGLVIAFAGLTAFVVLQNLNTGSVDMAKSETPLQTNESKNTGLANVSTNTNSMSATSDSLAESNSVANLETAPAATPEPFDEKSADERNQNGPNSSRDAPADTRDTLVARKERENDQVGVIKDAVAPPAVSESRVVDGISSDDRMTNAESKRSDPTPAKPAPEAAKRKSEGLSKTDKVLTTRGGELEDKDIEEKSATGARRANGKTFNRRDGVWYDASYQNQKTKNVRRGTNEYRNLDSGLRAIADKFTETVVVVWKQKAYRIQ